VLESAAGSLDRTGRLPRIELDDAIAALGEWRAGDAAALWYSLPLAEAVK
jgi:hypothetical protein